jgi:hypothetical protein
MWPPSVSVPAIIAFYERKPARARQVVMPAALVGDRHAEESALGGGTTGSGQQPFLAEATAQTHVTHVLANLGLRDRLQAVV